MIIHKRLKNRYRDSGKPGYFLSIPGSGDRSSSGRHSFKPVMAKENGEKIRSPYIPGRCDRKFSASSLMNILTKFPGARSCHAHEQTHDRISPIVSDLNRKFQMRNSSSGKFPDFLIPAVATKRARTDRTGTSFRLAPIVPDLRDETARCRLFRIAGGSTARDDPGNRKRNRFSDGENNCSYNGLRRATGADFRAGFSGGTAASPGNDPSSIRCY